MLMRRRKRVECDDLARVCCVEGSRAISLIMAQEGVGTESEALPVDLCLRCARPLNPLQNFCPHCGAPAGYAASLPFEHKLVLAQSLGLMFRRACVTPGAPLRRRALDVFVLLWVGCWPLFVLPAMQSIGPRFPISLLSLLVFPATVSISLVLAASGILLHWLRRPRD